MEADARVARAQLWMVRSGANHLACCLLDPILAEIALASAISAAIALGPASWRRRSGHVAGLAPGQGRRLCHPRL